jgi:hypothetical protein
MPRGERTLLLVIILLVWGSLVQSRAVELHLVRTALAEIETGATTPKKSKFDHMRGRNKEVSRYQILPRVWREYGGNLDYTNPDVAWKVTLKILEDRRKDFQKATGTDWDPFWLYAMWNAPHQCRTAKFDPRKLSPVVRDRAQRFSNLVLAYAMK